MSRLIVKKLHSYVQWIFGHKHIFLSPKYQQFPDKMSNTAAFIQVLKNVNLTQLNKTSKPSSNSCLVNSTVLSSPYSLKLL